MFIRFAEHHHVQGAKFSGHHLQFRNGQVSIHASGTTGR